MDRSAAEPRAHALLYDADGDDREIGLDDIDGWSPADSQLLWVDLQAQDSETIDKIARALKFPDRTRAAIGNGGTTPALGGGDVFWLRVLAVGPDNGSRRQGVLLTIVAGKHFVVTIHDEPVAYLDEMRKREDVDSHVGALSAESFTVALLDGHLSTYFDAVADFEKDIEKLEIGILAARRLDCLPKLRELRKSASRLRRMLAPHRTVYGGLSRPDFRPDVDTDIDRRFETLDSHFERAMDVVENSRELVVGTFELFSSQTALKTNESMAVLTFATVVLGLLACLAGVLGMNFDAAFFETKTTGFFVAAGAMVLLGVIALVIGKMKRWF